MEEKFKEITRADYEEKLADINARILSMQLVAKDMYEKTGDIKHAARLLMIYQFGEEATHIVDELEKSIVKES